MDTSARNHAYTIFALLGLALAGLLIGTQDFAPASSLLSSHADFFPAIVVLPLAIAVITATSLLFPVTRRRLVAVALSLILFLALGRGPAAALLVTHIILYLLERYLPRRIPYDRFLLLLGGAFALWPFAEWCLDPVAFPDRLPLLALIRDVFSLRTLSWLFHRRLFQRRDHEGWLPFLEYLFFPVFFVVPNLLCFVTFSYFHSRREQATGKMLLSAGAVALWGLAVACAYWFLERHWLEPVWRPLLWARAGSLDGWFLAGGFISHCVILLHHIGYMAFQVGISRLAGWQLRYDMVYPLLARSPMELWSRQHNYVKSYLVEEWIRPGTLTLMRLDFGWRWAVFWPALAGYSFFTAVFSGWRPFEAPRPPLVAIAMVLFFVLVVWAALLLRPRTTEASTGARSRLFAILRGEQPLEPIRQWHWYDFLLVAATLFLVSMAKAAMGYLRVLDAGP